MKNLTVIPFLAVIAGVSIAGCSAPAAQENGETTPAVTAPKTNEDERYRATSVDDQPFGPDATPEMIETYKTAMEKAHLPRPPLDMKVADKVRVDIKTNRGPITLELDAKAAPLHVKSFVYLAQQGFYDGTSFHRHADLLGGGKGYIIQGGDPLTKDAKAVSYAGLGGPGYEVPREKNALTHQKLIIAAARSQDPNSAGSQFYFTQDAVPFLDEGEGYTVFGKVVDGADAALKLKQGDTLQSVKVEETTTQPPAAKPAAPQN